METTNQMLDTKLKQADVAPNLQKNAAHNRLSRRRHALIQPTAHVHSYVRSYIHSYTTGPHHNT